MTRPRRNHDLPVHMHMRNGAYYFVTPREHKWLHFGRDRDIALQRYKAAMQSLDDGPVSAQRALILTKSDHVAVGAIPGTAEEKIALVNLARKLHERARRGATTRSLAFTLSRQDVVDLLVEAGGHCAVSGLPFSEKRVGKRSARPYAPSIDRIDSRKGYTRGNVRLVCYSVNIAMADYGDEVLLTIARAIVEKRQISSAFADSAREKIKPDSGLQKMHNPRPRPFYLTVVPRETSNDAA